LTIIALLGGNAAFADGQQTQSLSMTVGGTVVQSGDQHYYLHGNGLVSAQIGTLTFGPSSKIDYTMTVDVVGQSATGTAQFQISGRTGEESKATVTGTVQIVGMIPEEIPFGCVGAACTSAIPVFFAGVAVVNVTSGHHEDSRSRPSQLIQTGILLESPYFNPFGNALSIVSTDSPTSPSIVVVTTYDKATIAWTNSGVSGAIAGTLGTAPVSGTFSLVMLESENLVSGNSVDTGTIAFTNMSPTNLNAVGKFSGTSFIPNPSTPAGAAACAAEAQASLILTGTATPSTSDCTSTFAFFGLPAIPGTCTATGYQSDGTLSLVTSHIGQKGGDQGAKGNIRASPTEGGHHDVSVNGGYSTSWTSPALAFLSFSSSVVVPVPSTPGE
jgi:hypothetical protein